MNFIQRIFKKPPVLFPLVALFHVAMLVYYIWSDRTEPFPSAIWVESLWMLGFTISWLFTCDLKKWGALIYIGLTTANLFLHMLLKSETDLSYFTNAVFPADVAFSFFLLFYFKKFD